MSGIECDIDVTHSLCHTHTHTHTRIPLSIITLSLRLANTHHPSLYLPISYSFLHIYLHTHTHTHTHTHIRRGSKPTRDLILALYGKGAPSPTSTAWSFPRAALATTPVNETSFMGGGMRSAAVSGISISKCERMDSAKWNSRAIGRFIFSSSPGSLGGAPVVLRSTRRRSEGSVGSEGGTGGAGGAGSARSGKRVATVDWDRPVVWIWTASARTPPPLTCRWPDATEEARDSSLNRIHCPKGCCGHRWSKWRTR